MNFFKILSVFILLFSGFLSADTSSKSEDRLYLMSDKIETDDYIIESDDITFVLHKDGYMKADRVVVNKALGQVELFGNLNLAKNGLYFFVGNYARISLKNDGNHIIEEMFLYHRPRHVWLYSDYSEATDDHYLLKDTFLSSCRAENPDWGFYISDGEYRVKDEQYTLKNVIFYLYELPVFYFPYLSFSTKRERKTGLLTPIFSYSNKEGVFYSQPLFISLNKSSDLEIIPQYRTSRGQGVYAKYRFADSPYSSGYVKGGYFKDNQDFIESSNYAYSEHYGAEIYYKRENIFENRYLNVEDGFLANLKYLNDVEYLKLETFNPSSNDDSKIIESKLNYYSVYSEEYYFALHNSYIIDLSDVSTRETTLQNYPNFQFHKFYNEISPKFTYSFDYNFRNYTREEGSTATSYEFELPVYFNHSFFNNYLNLQLKNNFFASFIDFKNTNLYQDKYNIYFRHSQDLKLFTDLAKVYENNLHVLNFGVTATFQDFEKRNGFYNPEENFIDEGADCAVGDPCEFKSVDEVSDQLGLEFSEYLYNLDGDEILSHRMIQSIAFNDDKEASFSDLENEISLYLFDSLDVYSNFIYSYDLSRVSKVGTVLGYKEDKFKFDVSHIYQNNEDDNSNYLNSDLAFNIGKNYQIFGHYSYDFLTKDDKSKGIGWKMKKRCWNYEFFYKEQKRPVKTTTGTSSETETVVYFKVHLYPLGDFDYELK